MSNAEEKLISEEQQLTVVNDNQMNTLSKKAMHWTFCYETEDFIPPYDLCTEWFLAEVSQGKKKVRLTLIFLTSFTTGDQAFGCQDYPLSTNERPLQG